MSPYCVAGSVPLPTSHVANECATPANSIHDQYTPNASSRAIGRRNRRRAVSASTATGSQIGTVTVISTANASSAGTLRPRRRSRARWDR